MLRDYFGRVIIKPTTVEHHAGALKAMTQQIEMRRGKVPLHQVTIERSDTKKRKVARRDNPNGPVGALRFPPAVEEAMMMDATMRELQKRQ